MHIAFENIELKLITKQVAVDFFGEPSKNSGYQAKIRGNILIIEKAIILIYSYFVRAN